MSAASLLTCFEESRPGTSADDPFHLSLELLIRISGFTLYAAGWQLARLELGGRLLFMPPTKPLQLQTPLRFTAEGAAGMRLLAGLKPTGLADAQPYLMLHEMKEAPPPRARRSDRCPCCGRRS